MVYQTGQTVAGVGVATGQNTTLQQVAGDKPVKPTTTTTSLQPNNTGANNTNKTKPATNPPHTTQLPAGINRTTIADLVTTTTTTNKQQYYPGETASIQVSFRYNEVEYPMVQDIQSNQDSYTVKINFNVQLPAGFTISNETLTRGPFTRDCTNQRQCTQDGFQWNYNTQSHTLTGSFPIPNKHYKDGGSLQLFDEELNITGTVTGTPNTSHTVTTTADGVLDFSYIDFKTNSRADDAREPFTAIPSEAVFRVVPRKTVLKASFQPVGLTEGQVVVTGEVLCINPQTRQDRRTNLRFTLKHNELAGGKWNRELNNMVDAGSDCVITINKGAVPAGWRWKTPDRITQTEQNITTPRTTTIRLEVEKIPVEVSTETTATPTVAAGQQVRVISTIKASGYQARNIPVTIQLPRDGFVNTAATVNSTCTTTGRATCPAQWVYNANSHTVTATIPQIPAGGSIKVTVTGKAGFFAANSRRFIATTSATFKDTNQNNNTSRTQFNVTNKRVTVSLTVKPEGEHPTSGVVTVTGSINCVTPFKHNNTFTYTLNYAQLTNGAGAPQVIHKIVWAGSNCTVTVLNTTAPNGWEFTSQNPFAYQLQQVWYLLH
ncbi:hypothetical protein KJY78_06370 [Canibacter sp. lx-45]|uniref:hypothetical protein n=1 Tax=Canibacter zhuwentaonis TaxID=2837491 RepID=UPI001BDD6869|nr:hypothetical protein [Canibacter zhuwentaonis]MBT1035967.1 hypothetical protein [Canibacter zhuwentaonis]